jgi:hypothetical protein
MEPKKSPAEWQQLKNIDMFFFSGAAYLNRWFDNSLLTEEEFDDGIINFSTLKIGN